MTTTDDLIREVEADATAERGKLVASLLQIWEARQAKNEAGKDDTKLSGPVRQWLELNEGEELRDAEHGIRAYLTSSKRTEWDLRPLTDDEVRALRDAGLLSIQTAAFDALRKAAPTLTWDDINRKKGVRTEGESWSLQVKKEDS